MVKKSVTRKDKTINGTLKGTLKKNKFQLSTNPSTLRIINKSKAQFNALLEKKDSPLLRRLFGSANVAKLKSMPKEITDITTYSTIIKKEFRDLKKMVTKQPNQDFYEYVNYQWLQDQTEKLKKIPQYYVEVDDFRIIQDKVYKELLGYTNAYIKENPDSKKAKSIEAVTNCIQKASKPKGLQHCQEILKEVTHFIENEDLYGLLAYTNQDEIFSWQAPIVWSVRPDEKNVKKYISHLSPPQLGLYDYFIYIDDPSDDIKQKFKKNSVKSISNL